MHPDTHSNGVPYRVQFDAANHAHHDEGNTFLIVHVIIVNLSNDAVNSECEALLGCFVS